MNITMPLQEIACPGLQVEARIHLLLLLVAILA